MTRGQWTLIGLLVVQVMLIAVLRHPELKAAEDSGALLIAGFDPSSVTKIQVGTKAEETLTLQRDGSGWEIATAGGYPADAKKVEDLLDAIEKAPARAPVVTSDKYHESLEVTEEKAQARVRLFHSGEEGPFVDLILGKSTSGGAHVRLAGEENVYEVRDLTTWQLRPDTATWMQRELVNIPTESVQRVAVRNDNGSFELEKQGEEWIVALPEDAKGRSCETSKVEPILRASASLNVTGAAGPLDPSQGLGDDAVTVTLTHDEGSVTVRIGASVPDKTGQIYVTRDGFGFTAVQWETSLSSVKDAKLEDLLP